MVQVAETLDPLVQDGVKVLGLQNLSRVLRHAYTALDESMAIFGLPGGSCAATPSAWQAAMRPCSIEVEARLGKPMTSPAA